MLSLPANCQLAIPSIHVLPISGLYKNRNATPDVLIVSRPPLGACSDVPPAEYFLIAAGDVRETTRLPIKPYVPR